MEFHYRSGRAPDPKAIEDALAQLDPSVLLDVDASGVTVRISTVLRDDDILACLRRAGLPAAPETLERLPSVCCGGCSG